MNLVLYYGPQTCATAPFITLHEAGAEFEVRDVNSRIGGNRTPEFLAMNPKHKVPVLLVDGKPLTENAAIHFWIHKNFPAAKLFPADPWEEVQAISLLSWCASGIHPKLTPNARPENYCDLPGSEESVKRVARKLIMEDFALADGLLAGREWFFSHFTAPDAHFFWCFRRAISFGIDVSRFGNCQAHLERMNARPSVQKLIAHEKRVMEAFAKLA
ncbi:MAG: glutathione S-transferase family protein [Burkholderiales bacterium]|nr:glutathione S-transferase family protein [Burkholderiales bacterium]